MFIKKRVALILCSLLMIWIQPTIIHDNTHIVTDSYVSSLSSIYLEEHTPIIIESNAAFSDYDFEGSGSSQDPYLIEFLNITASGSHSEAVSIRYTTVYFVIKDCYIVSDYIGIECWDIADETGLIVNNTCISTSMNGAGVVAVELRNATIEGNQCYGFAQGIHLNLADRCTITRNNISDSTYQGINIRYSDNNIITYNRIENSSQHGLAFVGTSNSNLIHHNVFLDNGYEDTYRIDGERTGTLTSQGYDEGSQNLWYDDGQNTGNFWSDYSGSESYSIDGPSDASDLYPINEGAPDSVPSDYIISLVVLGVVIIPVLCLITYRYRRRG